MLRAPQHFDALDPSCATIVGDRKVGLHLYHSRDPFPFISYALTFSITSKRLFREIGRHSRILTLSPTAKLSYSSCAAYFLDRVIIFL